MYQFAGKSDAKYPVRKLRRGRKNNTKTDLQET
jgi:hypothetical protein